MNSTRLTRVGLWVRPRPGALPERVKLRARKRAVGRVASLSAAKAAAQRAA